MHEEKKSFEKMKLSKLKKLIISLYFDFVIGRI